MTLKLSSLATAILASHLLMGSVCAQQVRALNLDDAPPDMVHAAPEIDLGQPGADTVLPLATPPAVAPATGVAQQAAAAAQAGASAETVLRQAVPSSPAGAERATFVRQPVRVSLPVGVERLITLPAPAALHVPSDIEAVARIEVIDKTIYATALMPFTPLRLVAELVDSGQQIPLDIEAVASQTTAMPELQISVVAAAQASPSGTAAAQAVTATEAPVEVDMVELTRHAARQLYAPRRLAWASRGVSQTAVSTDAVPGLLRGADAEAVPLGQWKSSNLYVTAVRVTNRSRFPLEIPLDHLRGSWVAATAQHGRIGAAGSETDTTVIYLICERPFESCL